ncbi:hypothetical protein K440DRAFT_617087 [Wilcoxina mikolae CBS 423.85]|nr:hypothetical protein K440DRAFT_617087 [Wilcoxina mikolae CBS 423.85]
MCFFEIPVPTCPALPYFSPPSWVGLGICLLIMFVGGVVIEMLSYSRCDMMIER